MVPKSPSTAKGNKKRRSKNPFDFNIYIRYKKTFLYLISAVKDKGYMRALKVSFSEDHLVYYFRLVNETAS